MTTVRSERIVGPASRNPLELLGRRVAVGATVLVGAPVLVAGLLGAALVR